MDGTSLSVAAKHYTEPLFNAIGLPYLSVHIVTVLRSLLFWFSLQLLSAGISPRLFPRQFHSMSASKRVQWDMHVVSLVHSCIVAPTALYFWMNTDPQKTDMVFGYDYHVGQLYGISYGYFIWDSIQSLRYEGLQFFVHGLLASIANTFVWHPFLMFDGLGVLIWEASTPFLNFHWFMDKLGMTGSKAQLINAVFLLSSYVSMRLVLGVYISYSMIHTLWNPSVSVGRAIPLYWKFFYTGGLITLNALNYFWFSKMIQAIRKRFVKEKI